MPAAFRKVFNESYFFLDHHYVPVAKVNGYSHFVGAQFASSSHLPVPGKVSKASKLHHP
jgi:hypothetical protein